MAALPSERKIFEFGAFRFDQDDRLLVQGGHAIPLTPKAADVLLLLLSRAGHVVERDELMKTVWPDTFVEESSLTRNISQLRKVLGEDDAHPYIETIPKRGYRFVAEVRAAAPGADDMPGTPGPKAEWLLWLAAVALLVVLLGAPRILSNLEPENRMQEVPFTAFPGGEYEPVFARDGTRVAFVWNGPDEKHFGIYTKPVGGGDAQPLVVDAADEGSPAWSPDGRQIAFVRYGTPDSSGVYIIGLQDKVERKLAPTFPLQHLFSRALDWSPDGSAIVVADMSSAEGPLHLDMLRTATGARRGFTTPPTNTAGDSSPVFSPDGKKVAFKRATGSNVDNVFLIDAAGGVPRQLTSEKSRITALDWSEDGREIVFASKRAEGAGAGLWRIPLKGGTPRRIPAAENGASYFSIARRGRRLAYSSWFADTNIWRLAADEPKAAEKLIASTRAETSAQYSPDGTQIAFRSDQSGATEIWIADGSGKNARQLTSFHGPLTGSPRWSPDGRLVAFDSRPEGKSNIYVISSAGGPPRRITGGSADNVVPSWSQDGRWVYFASNRSGAWEICKTRADGSGEFVQLTHAGGFAAFEALDGSYVYYAKSSNSPGLWRVPAAGGPEEPVVPDLKTGYWGCWGIAKGGIYFVDPAGTGRFDVRVFDPVSRQTKTAATLPGEPPFGDAGFSVSRDGRWFLFTQTDHSGSDILLIHNFR